MSRAPKALAFVAAGIVACTDPASPPTTLNPPDLRRAAAGELAPYDLGHLGGGSALARDINALGAVVGSSMTESGEPHAFLWTRGGGMRDLGTLPGDTRSDANAINIYGEIVGTSGTRAVRWTRGGRIVPLESPPNADYSVATDINSIGLITGFAQLPPQPLGFDAQTVPLIWKQRSRLQLLPVPEPNLEGFAEAVNELGQLAGTVGLDDIHVTHASRWRQRPGWDVLEPERNDTWATDLNELGDVVGYDFSVPYRPVPLIWRRGGEREELPGLGGARGGYARGVNTSRQVVGLAFMDEIGTTAGVVWDRRGGVTPLPGLDGWDAFPNAINELGEVVGGSGPYAVIWTNRAVTTRSAARTIPGVATRVAGATAGATGGAAARTTELPAWLESERRQCSRGSGAGTTARSACLERAP